MDVVPISVGKASRAWDEQNIDLTAGAGQVGGAPASGFTAPVAGAASRFATAWEKHVQGLADEAEEQADGLRDSIRDYLETEGRVSGDLMVLRTFLEELR